MEEDALISERLSELATRWRLFGYKRLHVLLRREGLKSTINERIGYTRKQVFASANGRRNVLSKRGASLM